MKLPARLTLALAAVATGIAALGPAAAPAGDPNDTPNRLYATIDGEDEVPGPGDPDGFGFVTIDLRRQAGRVCHDIEWHQIRNPAQAGHIHAGRQDQAGPIKVTLFQNNRTDGSTGCTNGIGRALIDALKTNPARFYVNIHNGPFPNGAIRGQLTQHP